MSDRELLEMAAKAAGLGEVWYLEGSDTPYVGKRYELGKPIAYSTFSPLTDDGDALRLALRIEICWWDSDQVWTVFKSGNEQDSIGGGGLDDAAIRRAIVRAAAEIGKAMP